MAPALPDDGARCVHHPAVPAVVLCSFCGDYLCAACQRTGCQAAGCPLPVRVDGGEEADDVAPMALRSGEAWAVAVPWEARDVLGWPRAFYHSQRRLLVQPRRFFAELPQDRDIWPALVFGALSFALGAGSSLILVAWSDLPANTLPLLLLLATLPFIGVYRSAFTGLLLWVGLGVFSGQVPSWRGVARVAAYGQGADLYLPLGGVGLYLGTWLHTVGLREAFGEPWWRAALVALLPLAVFHLLVLGALGIYLTVGGGVV